MDKDGSGVLTVPELLDALRARLPPEEVQTALELALQEAGSNGASAAASAGSSGDAMTGGIDFEGFLNLLKVGCLAYRFKTCEHHLRALEAVYS